MAKVEENKPNRGKARRSSAAASKSSNSASLTGESHVLNVAVIDDSAASHVGVKEPKRRKSSISVGSSQLTDASSTVGSDENRAGLKQSRRRKSGESLSKASVPIPAADFIPATEIIVAEKVVACDASVAEKAVKRRKSAEQAPSAVSTIFEVANALVVADTTDLVPVNAESMTVIAASVSIKTVQCVQSNKTVVKSRVRDIIYCPDILDKMYAHFYDVQVLST